MWLDFLIKRRQPPSPVASLATEVISSQDPSRKRWTDLNAEKNRLQGSLVSASLGENAGIRMARRAVILSQKRRIEAQMQALEAKMRQAPPVSSPQVVVPVQTKVDQASPPVQVPRSRPALAFLGDIGSSLNNKRVKKAADPLLPFLQEKLSLDRPQAEQLIRSFKTTVGDLALEADKEPLTEFVTSFWKYLLLSLYTKQDKETLLDLFVNASPSAEIRTELEKLSRTGRAAFLAKPDIESIKSILIHYYLYVDINPLVNIIASTTDIQVSPEDLKKCLEFYAKVPFHYNTQQILYKDIFGPVNNPQRTMEIGHLLEDVYSTVIEPVATSILTKKRQGQERYKTLRQAQKSKVSISEEVGGVLQRRKRMTNLNTCFHRQYNEQVKKPAKSAFDTAKSLHEKYIAYDASLRKKVFSIGLVERELNDIRGVIEVLSAFMTSLSAYHRFGGDKVSLGAFPPFEKYVKKGESENEVLKAIDGRTKRIQQAKNDLKAMMVETFLNNINRIRSFSSFKKSDLIEELEHLVTLVQNFVEGKSYPDSLPCNLLPIAG